jgi:hypothetical protein
MDESTVTARSSHPMKLVTAAAVAMSVGLLWLPACSGNDSDNGSGSPSGASSSAAPSAAVKAVAFDEPYRTDDGVVVQITEIDESTLGPFPRTDDPDAMEGDPYVLLTTKTTNSTKSTLQYVPTAVLRYGPEKTAAAEVSVDELDAAQDVEPNEAFDYTLGFIIPKESYDQVVMEMTVTLDPLRTVIFSGSITPT